MAIAKKKKSITKRVTSAPQKKKITKEHWASVPDVSYYDAYVSRNVADGVSDFDVFDYARSNKINVLIEGGTGASKTSSIIAYAAKEERPFYAISSNIGIEPSQLFGKFIPTEDGNFKFIDGPVTHLVRDGGVLLINEVNFMPERIATVLFSLLDKRREITLLDNDAEVIKAHDDLLIVADMNPEYEGTRPLNKAFRNRFGIQMQWDYDPEVEAALVFSPTLRDLANDVRVETQKGTYVTPTSTNMLMEFEKIALGIGYDFAVKNFLGHYASDERDALLMLFKANEFNLRKDLNNLSNRPALLKDFGITVNVDYSKDVKKSANGEDSDVNDFSYLFA